MRDREEAQERAKRWPTTIAQFLEDQRTPGPRSEFHSDTDNGRPERIRVLNEIALLDMAASSLHDELAPARIGMGVKRLDPSFMAFVMLNARRMDDSIANAVRLARVDRTRASVLRQDFSAGVFLKVETSTSRSRIHGSHLEFLVSAITAALGTAIGMPLLPVEIRFAHHRAPEHGERLSELLGGPVRFGCETSGVLLERRDLQLPVVRTDNRLLARLDSIGVEVLARSPANAASVTARTEQAIVDHLQTGDATQATIAGVLGVSARTLARWLDREDQTFGGVLSSLRHRLADRYLQEPALTLAEVTFLLGYADQSSFTTAYKGWCGRSPGQVRSLLGLRS